MAFLAYFYLCRTFLNGSATLDPRLSPIGVMLLYVLFFPYQSLGKDIYIYVVVKGQGEADRQNPGLS